MTQHAGCAHSRRFAGKETSLVPPVCLLSKFLPLEKDVMTHPLAYPLRFAPFYKAYIWGGGRIAARFGRQGLPANCGEAWEISAHPDGNGPLLNGALAGVSLAALAQRFQRDLVGTAAPEADRFPLLFKIIDAQANLSVQVHPTLQAARLLDSECKNESWHLLNGAPGAMLYAGLAPGTTPGRLRDALSAGSAESLLIDHPAIPGQTLFIPSGLVHAIGSGCLIYEVQQNANTTYRLYDWNRLDAAGRRRPLHIEESLTSIDWSLPPPTLVPAQDAPDIWHTCSATDYFTLQQARLTRPCTREPAGRSFQVLFVADGICDVAVGTNVERLGCGASCLIPACAASYTLTPVSPSVSLLVTTL